MKLVNAKLYEEQIKKEMWKIWYDEKYQYYFGGLWRCDFSLNENTNEYQKIAFAVLNSEDELIGVIKYSVDREINLACWFGAINFSNDVFTFGRALRQVVEDCFLKFGMEIVEWKVICGNPIEKNYDRLCKEVGGKLVGVTHKRAVDLAGNRHDEKTYEILREDFMKAREKRMRMK